MEQNVIRATESEFVQVGVYAARDPRTHEFLPGVALYIRRTPEVTASEMKLCEDIGKRLAEKYRMFRERMEADRSMAAR